MYHITYRLFNRFTAIICRKAVPCPRTALYLCSCSIHGTYPAFDTFLNCRHQLAIAILGVVATAVLIAVLTIVLIAVLAAVTAAVAIVVTVVAVLTVIHVIVIVSHGSYLLTHFIIFVTGVVCLFSYQLFIILFLI